MLSTASITTRIRANSRGLMSATFVAAIASLLGQHYSAPAMLFALLLGICVSFLYKEEQFRSGIEFASTHVLRFGVALLGLRIVFSDLVAMGWQTAAVLLFAIVSTILIGIILARLLNLSGQLGTLTGGAVAICGASAAMAIAAVLPKNQQSERNTLITIIGITSLSTTAMILYPVLASYLELPEEAVSLFLGGTIHDVAQVVGAGYSISEHSGDQATLVKLIRVSFLMPIVACIVVFYRSQETAISESKRPLLPGFLVAFIVLAGFNSLIEIPAEVLSSAADISRFSLVIAIAGIGMKTDLAQLRKVGFRPILLMLLETMWIALFVLTYVWLSAAT